jgi:hypothetical protein
MSGVQFPVRAVLDDKGIEDLIRELTKAGKQAGLTEDKIEHMNNEIRKTGTEGVKSTNNINKGMNNLVNDGIRKVGTAFVAAFAADRLISLQKEIIKITSEFQTFEAVLTNTLGSKSAAQIALRQIQDFAAKTPFSVQQLTASYVKLANQGFKPTTDELRKLGDLASSTGKGFDMLTEAIIDAQVGEFERLKEFGIRAKKQGDQVTFSFKGVETQTKFTADAIRQYVLSLGDAEGVTGSMAAISNTLGGSISNLGDSWDKFLKTIGDGESGVLKNAIKNLSSLLAIATDWVTTQEQMNDDTVVKAQEKAVETLNRMAKSYGDVNVAAEDYKKFLNLSLDLEFKRNNSISRADIANKEIIDSSNLRISVLKGEIQAVDDYVASENKATLAKKDGENATRDLANAEQGNADAAFAKYVIEQNAIKARAKAQAEANAALIKENKYALDVQAGDTEGFRKLEEKEAKEQSDRIKNHKKENAEELTEHQQEQADIQAEIQAQAIQLGAELLQSFADFKIQKVNDELAALQNRYSEEISFAGDNEEAKSRIKKKFDAEERRIKIKKAKAEKEAALIQIAINTAVAIASASPVVPLMALAAVVGVAQAAIVANQKVPQFKDGVFDLQGPGTSTSDSISAKLSKNESVVHAKGSRKFAAIIKPIIEDKNLSWSDVKNIVDQNIPSHLRGDLFLNRKNENGNLDKKLDELISAVTNKQETHIDIDENGFNRWTRKEDRWIKHINKRYRV